MRLRFLAISLSAAVLLGLSCGSQTSEKPDPKLQPENSTAQPGSPFTDTVRNTVAGAVGSGSTSTRGFTEADFDRHVKELRMRIQTKLSSNQFSIVIQAPFVVVGDEPEAMVRERATDTVKWAVDRLKQDFFTKDPDQILDIWLFKDEESYRKHTRLMFGDVPSTPYGYYSRNHKALIMNIGTGGGTLVHEIVHPFIEANFPTCPPWLNEGLGSLYEQCGDVDGHIRGFTNWRLPGLQKAIRENRVSSFKTLMELDSRGFYNDDSGVNYAQSRYLCYYLQEKGLLVKFYKDFLKRQTEDPSGFKSLQTVLAETDIDAFKKRWEKYVLGLRQGYSVTVE
jgi:hypothetical protein